MESHVFEAMNPPNLPTTLQSVKFLGSSTDSSIVMDNSSKTITSPSNTPIQFLQLPGTQLDVSKIEYVVRFPFILDRVLLCFNKEINTENLVCILSTGRVSSSYKVTSSEAKLPFNNDFTGLIELIIEDSGTLLTILQFYREPIPVPVVRRSSRSAPLSINEQKDITPDDKKTGMAEENPFPIPMGDGPLFREAISTYEQLVPLVLKKIHSTSHKSSSGDTGSKGTDNSKSAMGSLKDFSKGLLPIAPRSAALFSKFDASTTTSNDFTRRSLNALRQLALDPKVDFAAIKSLQTLNSNKKNFEEDSKRYYDWLSKLMGSGKTKDEKLLTKMKSFQINQINYFNYLFDIVTPTLLSLVKPEQQLMNNYWRDKPLREQAVNKIAACSKMEEYESLMRRYSLLTTSESTPLFIDPNSTYQIGAESQPVKTGLLFVHGGQGKSGWHKQWLVLCNSDLYEFMDWRKGTELRNKPVNVSMCNIKLIDSVDNCNSVSIGSRKNCFRVINPQGVEHVFQAFTPHEANDWVKALSEAGQMNTYKSRSTTGSPSDTPSMDVGRSGLSKKQETKDRHATRIRRVSSVSLSLLNVVRTSDPSNKMCADCGATEQVDWISINLLVVFCIHCSSAHRSLGTSVSKVRSLTLDSFGPEHRVLIHHINNQRMNALYEAHLPVNTKPTATSDHESRLKYIRDKYVHKVYVDDETRKNASFSLRKGVREDDVYEVLKGLAGGANVNTKFHYKPGTVSSSASILSSSQKEPNMKLEVTYLEYSLLHPSVLDESEVFDVAELLALNGCDVGSQVRPDSLVDERAKMWWQHRIDKMSGKCTDYPNPVPKLAPSISSRSNSSGFRPMLVLPKDGKHQESTNTNSRSKIRSPKDGFNLFKKKIRNLD